MACALAGPYSGPCSSGGYVANGGIRNKLRFQEGAWSWTATFLAASGSKGQTDKDGLGILGIALVWESLVL